MSGFDHLRAALFPDMTIDCNGSNMESKSSPFLKVNYDSSF